MSKNLDKLKGHSDIKQDINRRAKSDVKGKEGLRLNKRINDIAKVIADPDQWNVNIGSRDRMDELERIVEQRKQILEELERRVDGLAHLVRSIAFNRRLVDEDIQAIENRMDDDNNISSSVE